MDSPHTSEKVNIEIPSLPRLRRRIVKSEPITYELDVYGGNNKSKSDSGDHSSCDMTLKDLKERCKKKKKFLKSCGLRKENISIVSCFDVGQEHAYVKIKEEESDLEQPLSAWKRKCSNKAKTKRIEKPVDLSLEAGVSVEVITEQIHNGSEDSLPSATNKHDRPNIRLGPDCSDCQNTACVTDSSAPEGFSIKDIFREFPDEIPKSVTGGDMENVMSNSLVKDSPKCVVNEVSFEYLKLCEPKSLSQSATMNFRENVESGFPQTIYEPLPFPISEMIKEDAVANPVTNYNLEGAIPATGDMGSDVRESCKVYSFQPQISCQIDCGASLQHIDKAIDDSVQSKVLKRGRSSCVTDMKGVVDSNKDTPTHLNDNVISNFGSLHSSSREFYPSCNYQPGADSVYDDSPIAKKHLVCTANGAISAAADVAGECLSMTPPSASYGFSATEVFESQHGVRQDRLPRRFFSTRKAISPTSQEKLRQAVDFEELYDSVGNASLEGTKVSVHHGQFDARPKKNNNMPSQSVPKGILKASPTSLGKAHDGTESSRIPTRAQKAVAFSQRQMHDIESLSMKLMKELKSMKDIVEECLCSKEYSSTPPKYTADEMRTTIQSAAEVEETTNRWLSMMERDCNRFCKIMRSTGKTTAAERKKITFADEAGGMLCHVKILEDCPDSELAPETENVHLDM